MQRDLLPNTYRDINELPPLSRSTSEPMEVEPGFRRPIIHTVDNEQIDGSSKHNEITNRSLLKTSVRTNANDIDRLQSTTNDENALAQATGFDSNFGTAIDADEAFARELQQKEYSRESLVRTRHPYERFRIPSDDEVRVVDSDHSLEPDVMPHFETDEEFAAYLQAQEDRKRERMQRRPFPFFPVPPARPNHPTSSENDQRPHHHVFPTNYHFSRRPNHNNADDDDDDNDGDDYRAFPLNNPHALLQLLGHPSLVFGPQRNYRRTGNLQDTEDDFGPEDYERLLQLDDTIKKKKLSQHQVNSIKEISFHSNANNTDEENKCSVCLENFEENQSLRQFPCQHVYHKQCADQWLRENNVCPICRKPPININTQSSSNSSRRRHYDQNKHSNSNNNNNHRQHPPNYNRSSTNRQPSNNSSTMFNNSQSRRGHGHGHGHPPSSSSSFQRPS